MSRNLKKIMINIEDVTFIFNNELRDFNFVTSRCFCANCKTGYNSTITNFKISLNELFDIILQGFCQTCNHPMGRYIETGENQDTASNAEAIWKTHKTLKKLKIKPEK